ncbi:hypothetical protein Q7C36_009763 [Tachysurus vachellii]|uniref:Uncharacterized protein n=1 Tax=Tachysurus vachellii TaxID=175792 RepID=A0AA88N1S5_TACVA|nr:hypothetical protein Q7C36_009763 [Tachysurus vachellii]
MCVGCLLGLEFLPASPLCSSPLHPPPAASLLQPAALCNHNNPAVRLLRKEHKEEGCEGVSASADTLITFLLL